MYIIYQILSFVKRFSESFLKKFSSKNGVQAVGKGSSGCRRGLGSRFEDHCVTGAATLRNELRRPQVFATVALTLSTGFAAIVRSIARRLRR